MTLGDALTEYFEGYLEWKKSRYVPEGDGYSFEFIDAQTRAEWGTKKFVDDIVNIVAHPERYDK